MFNLNLKYSCCRDFIGNKPNQVSENLNGKSNKTKEFRL